MKPYKTRDIVDPVANHFGIPTDHVQDIMKYYFRYMKIQMQDLKGIAFYVPGLGTFGLQGWKLEKELEKANKSVNNRTSEVTKAVAKEWKKKVEDVKTIWDSEMLRRKEVQQKKREHINRKNNGSERDTIYCLEK